LLKRPRTRTRDFSAAGRADDALMPSPDYEL
jgi:hypothetical protein